MIRVVYTQVISVEKKMYLFIIVTRISYLFYLYHKIK